VRRRAAAARCYSGFAHPHPGGPGGGWGRNVSVQMHS
jgi:hypothetical protein